MKIFLSRKECSFRCLVKSPFGCLFIDFSDDTEVANTGIYEQIELKTSEKVRFYVVLGPHN